jgi:YD repeat-containing protein
VAIETAYNVFGDPLTVTKIFPADSSKNFFLSKCGYDTCGRLTKRTNAQGGLQNITYDSFNRTDKIEYTDALSSSPFAFTSFWYDDEPNLLSFYQAKRLEYAIRKPGITVDTMVVKVTNE